MIRALAVALWLVTNAAQAAPPTAEDSTRTEARLLLQQGNALFARGDLRGALANFRAAYALYPSPRLLINAAAAERELGDVAAAANDLSAYLEEPDGDAALTARAAVELRALVPSLAKVGLAPGWPAGSSLELDGRTVPSGTWVRPGPHRLRGRAPDGRQQQQTTTLVDGDDIRLHLPVTAPPTRSRALVIGLVGGTVAVVAVGLGLGLGLGFGLNRTSAPVGGELGVLRFSDFH